MLHIAHELTYSLICIGIYWHDILMHFQNIGAFMHATC